MGSDVGPQADKHVWKTFKFSTLSLKKMGKFLHVFIYCILDVISRYLQSFTSQILLGEVGGYCLLFFRSRRMNTPIEQHSAHFNFENCCEFDVFYITDVFYLSFLLSPNQKWQEVVLEEFRKQLTLAYLSDMIDTEEYVYLYTTNESQDIFPYWKFSKFDFDNWDDTECYTELCFRKNDIVQLLICLGIPEKIACPQRTSCSGLEGLCTLLKILAYPCQYSDMVSDLVNLPIFLDRMRENAIIAPCFINLGSSHY